MSGWEGRGPKIKLIGGIDDATKDVPWAKFAYQDSVEENMATSKEIINKEREGLKGFGEHFKID